MLQFSKLIIAGLAMIGLLAGGIPCIIKTTNTKKKFFVLPFYKDMDIPKPHAFVALPLQSAVFLPTDIPALEAQLANLLPQLSDLIGQFNQTVSTYSINIVIDTSGGMILDLPDTIPDADANIISKRMGILDRVIRSQTDYINTLVNQGLSIEASLRQDHHNYTSQILNKVNEFNRIKASYGHY